MKTPRILLLLGFFILASHVVTASEPDAFLDGTDRTVKKTDWGSVSVPAEFVPGEEIAVQVAFAAKSVEQGAKLVIHVHGLINGERNAGFRRSPPIAVEPGVTDPYSAEILIPDAPGLERIAVTVYVSPDASWENATLKTSVPVPMKARP